MKAISRALFLAVLLALVAVPVFGNDCKACMGWAGCNVSCGDGYCQCIQEGPPIYCMTIVVSG